MTCDGFGVGTSFIINVTDLWIRGECLQRSRLHFDEMSFSWNRYQDFQIVCIQSSQLKRPRNLSRSIPRGTKCSVYTKKSNFY